MQFYAIRETVNLNDFLLHWTEAGVEGLRWPSRFTRYNMVWPDDVSMYSHYMRPPAADDDEAQLTAVEMPLSNVPIIEYQDPLDRPRAALTDRFAFYTHLDATQPAHRTLLRFMAGEDVAFERVFSWFAADLSVEADGSLRAHNRLAEVLGLPTDPADEEAPPPLPDCVEPDDRRLRFGQPLHGPSRGGAYRLRRRSHRGAGG